MYTTDSTNIAVYNHLMKVAKEIALTNPKGLPDLIRAILRPLQSEHLLAVAERGQDALPNLDGAWFFGFPGISCSHGHGASEVTFQLWRLLAPPKHPSP